MYGSVLSGGLGGHIYGAGGWQGGLWSGEVEAASKYPIWEAIRWPSGDQMRHLKTFVMSAGARYQDLIPAVDRIDPNKAGKPASNVGWAYCARTPENNLFLIYFERDCPQAVLSGMSAGARYQGRWFNPRTGRWLKTTPVVLTADSAGKIALPQFLDKSGISNDDWALKLTLTQRK